MYFTNTKRLIWALAVSGFLNIILLTSIFYWTIRERSPALYCEHKIPYKAKQQALEEVDESGSRLIYRMKALPYDQLVAKLKSTSLVENGYTERDLALASLVTFHHFDIARALGGAFVPQERLIVYGRHPNGSSAVVRIYPALSDTHFNSIMAFASAEKWPQTPQGLFLLLQRKDGQVEPSLLEAFYMTPEFLAVESIFRRVEIPINKSEIVEFLLSGDWRMLANYYEQQRQSMDLSDARRQNILLAYAQRGSQVAAHLFLKMDNTAVKKLDDAQVAVLLEALKDRTEESEKFAIAILTSPRSDAVRQLAAVKLYAYAGEKVPQPFQYRAALQRFVGVTEETQIKPTPPKAIPKHIVVEVKKQNPTTPSKADRLYIIQEGDNLWKLSRRFNVDIAILRNYNKLSSDTLVPGSALRIPNTE